MTASTESLAHLAMTLPAAERAELAHRLIASLDVETDAETDADLAGRAEALRRLGEIERGEVHPISEEDLFRRVRSRFGR